MSLLTEYQGVYMSKLWSIVCCLSIFSIANANAANIKKNTTLKLVKAMLWNEGLKNKQNLAPARDAQMATGIIRYPEELLIPIVESLKLGN